MLGDAAREGTVVEAAHVAKFVPEVEVTVEVEESHLSVGLALLQAPYEAEERGVGNVVVSADHDRHRALTRYRRDRAGDRLGLCHDVALVQSYVPYVEDARRVGHRPNLAGAHVDVSDGLGL